MGDGDPAIGAWPKQLHAWLRKSGLLTTIEQQAISGQILIDGKPLNRGWVAPVPLDSPNKPVACSYRNHRQPGRFTLAAGDGPCIGPHRIAVRQLALEQVGTPTLEDVVLFTKATRDAKEEMKYEVKVSEKGQADPHRARDGQVFRRVRVREPLQALHWFPLTFQARTPELAADVARAFRAGIEQHHRLRHLARISHH